VLHEIGKLKVILQINIPILEVKDDYEKEDSSFGYSIYGVV
jgi:hypothetical protein